MLPSLSILFCLYLLFTLITSFSPRYLARNLTIDDISAIDECAAPAFLFDQATGDITDEANVTFVFEPYSGVPSANINSDEPTNVKTCGGMFFDSVNLFCECCRSYSCLGLCFKINSSQYS